MPNRDSTSEILNKYGKMLESELNTPGHRTISMGQGVYSREYETFRQEMIPELTRYERWANSLGSIIKIRVAEKDRVRIQNYLNVAHLNVSAEQAVTLAIMSVLGIFFLTVFGAAAVYLINGSTQLLFVFLGLIASAFIFYYAYSLPQRLANAWRLRASSEMVPAILYIVVYMKHTSNIERAIEFAAQHLEGPLALDLKKIFYDVEVGKYSTIKQSLENYLYQWKDYSPEFVESFHLIESSLFEPADGRRVEILEKSLQVILNGVYEKMLKYSRDIRTPLTNLYMLGIILPTLGLALLPLASTLLGGIFRWPHIFVLFNIIIPFFVFYMVSEVLMKRPGGYGESSSISLNPYYKTFTSKSVWVSAFILALPFFVIGLTPFILQSEFITSSLGLKSDYTLGGFFSGVKYFDFIVPEEGGKAVGPFGPVAMLLGLFIPFSIALFFSVAYLSKTKRIIKTRNNTRDLENEFANSLFQLGNRLADGIPAEIAFGRVANSTQNQKSSEFFSLVNYNISQGGMPLDRAIFDSRRGAIIYFPSALIATSMKILTESVKKGLKIAARSLMSISEYVNNIKKINDRLKDLLAEIVSDMKSNMTFLAPLLSGIVVGLASMITSILAKLEQFKVEGSDVNIPASFADIGQFFSLKDMIPPYFIQISIGIYIIQVIFILTGALVTVDAGKDIIREKYELARNLRSGFILYVITAFIAIFALNILANVALKGLAG